MLRQVSFFSLPFCFYFSLSQIPLPASVNFKSLLFVLVFVFRSVCRLCLSVLQVVYIAGLFSFLVRFVVSCLCCLLCSVSFRSRLCSDLHLTSFYIRAYGCFRCSIICFRCSILFVSGVRYITVCFLCSGTCVLFLSLRILLSLRFTLRLTHLQSCAGNFWK